MLVLVIPYSENTIRYAMTLVFFLVLALLHKSNAIFLPIFILPLLGLLSGEKPHLKLLTLEIPYSVNPNVRYYIVFSLGPFYLNKSQFCYQFVILTAKLS